MCVKNVSALDKVKTNTPHWRMSITTSKFCLFQSVVEIIKVIIPQAAEQIFESIQGIVKGFMNLFKDPKTSLFNIGKGVIV